MAEVNPAVAEATETVVKELVQRVGALTTSLKTAADQVAELKTKHEGLASLDLVKTVKDFDKVRSQVEVLQKSIQTRTGGLYFPGVEDCAQKFNLLRLIAGVKQGKAAEMAPFEMEVVKYAKEAAIRNMGPAMKAGHVMWDDVTSGIWIPDQIIADIIGPVYTQSAFVALDASTGETTITVIDGLTGGVVKIPEFQGGMIAYWIGEEDDYTESKTKSGNVTLTPKKLGVLTRITAEMMMLASPAFDTFMRRDMVRATAKKLDYTVAYGTGTANMPIGISNHPKIKKFLVSTQADATSVSGNGGTADFDTLMNCIGAMEDDDVQADASSRFVAHPRYWRQLKQRKVDYYSGQTTNEGYLFGPFMSDARLRETIGNFGRSTQINTTKTVGSATAKCTDIFGGNLGEYIFGRWGGLQIMDDAGEGTGFIRDQTYVKMRMWGDMECRQVRAIRHIPDAIVR